jgi:[ribosomal protein S18]-alanine N-acetyltransferase
VAVTLRPMRWWDVEPALALERVLFPDDAWSAETFWSELAGVPSTRHYLVAVDGDEVVGYAGLFAADHHQADVQTVAVAPGRQGQGIGDRLLGALLEEAARRGCTEILLEVRADNAAAQRLYARHGFERIGLRRGYYQPGRVDALVLRRRPPAHDAGPLS